MARKFSLKFSDEMKTNSHVSHVSMLLNYFNVDSFALFYYIILNTLLKNITQTDHIIDHENESFGLAATELSADNLPM